MTDSFPNNPEIILSGLEKVKNEIKKVGIEIEIEAAAEYYFDETLMPKIKKKSFTFGDNYVLNCLSLSPLSTSLSFKTHGGNW